MADHSRFGSPHPGVRVRRGRSRRRARGVPDGIRHDGSAVLSEGPPRFHRRRHGRFVKSNRGVPLLRLPKPVPEIAGRVLGSARGGNGNAIGNRASGTADGEALYGPRMGFRDGTALLPPPSPETFVHSANGKTGRRGSLGTRMNTLSPCLPPNFAIILQILHPSTHGTLTQQQPHAQHQRVHQFGFRRYRKQNDRRRDGP